MEQVVRQIIKRHRVMDLTETNKDIIGKEKQYMRTIKKRADKIKKWLKNNDDKPGKKGTPIKSNITDNDSAKMKTSHGVIQGYNGVAVVDHKHQVIVHAEAFGAAQEHDLLCPMIEGCIQMFRVRSACQIVRG